jgi:hypothetical protein
MLIESEKRSAIKISMLAVALCAVSLACPGCGASDGATPYHKELLFDGLSRQGH